MSDGSHEGATALPAMSVGVVFRKEEECDVGFGDEGEVDNRREVGHQRGMWLNKSLYTSVHFLTNEFTNLIKKNRLVEASQITPKTQSGELIN